MDAAAGILLKSSFPCPQTLPERVIERIIKKEKIVAEILVVFIVYFFTKVQFFGLGKFNTSLRFCQGKMKSNINKIEAFEHFYCSFSVLPKSLPYEQTKFALVHGSERIGIGRDLRLL